jgi:hypothetical protein
MGHLIKTYAIAYFEKFGFNVFPLIGKAPKIKWDVWQSKKQTIDDINKMDWAGETTGIGSSAGINDVRVIDIDKIKNWIILEMVLLKLNLDLKYPWIVKTGSGMGAHIYVKIKETSKMMEVLGDKAVYKLYLKDDELCDHVEIRWKNCQNVLPPSMHPSGGIYNFYDINPETEPIEIQEDMFIDLINELFVLEDKTENRTLKLGGKKPKYLNPRVDFKRLEAATQHLGEHLPENCYEDWYRLGFGLASIGEQGRKYFIEMSLANNHYNDSEVELNKKFDQFLKDYNGKVTLGTVYAIAENYGWEKPKIKFWYITDGKIKIMQTRFIKFLESCGFYKLYLNPGYVLIRIKDNVVEEIETVNIKDYVIDYVNNLSEEDLDGIEVPDLLEVIVRGNNIYFGSSQLEFLSPIELFFSRDSLNKSLIYFQNGYVEVTKNSSVLVTFKKLEGYVWKHQILNRAFKESKRKSDFEILLWNICREDVERFNSLRSAIGYLLHTYKDVALTKAIVFIDEVMSDGANGRSCKSLVGVAISKIRKTLRIGARNFNFKNTFAFQAVTLDTAIIEFNDAEKKFPFDRLFTVITDGISVEKKNKDQITIQFSESPKVLISTNFTIEGVDRSTVDRQFVVEFSDFYNEVHRPIHDFSKRLFEADWNDEDWAAFDNFMIGCIQYYLANGLVECSFVNLIEKKLIDMTCKEFVEFMDDYRNGESFDKKKVYKDFVEQNEDYNHLKQNTFTKWIKTYCSLRNYEYEQWRDDKVYYFKIKLKKAA